MNDIRSGYNQTESSHNFSSKDFGATREDFFEKDALRKCIMTEADDPLREEKVLKQKWDNRAEMHIQNHINENMNNDIYFQMTEDMGTILNKNANYEEINRFKLKLNYSKS